MNMPVSVGGPRRMSNNAPLPYTPGPQDEVVGPPTFEPIPYSNTTGGRRLWRPGSTIFAPRTTTPPPTQPSLLGTGTTFLDTVRSASMDTGGAPFMSAGGIYEPSSAEQAQQLLAMFASQAGDRGGSRGPDYSAYRAALTGQAEDINARIQAMYNELAKEAGANVERISGIYGGAKEGIGNVYDSATGNVEQAFGSAQQQASDQLARLGIEAAAPTVINPMALSQAQAVSGLEQGRASGQAANERFGSAASGFGSQMAQVAQQQGTEMNAAVLAALQNRLNETLLMEEQGRASGGGGGGGNPMDSAMDFLRLQEMIEAPGLAREEMAMRAQQIAADNTLSQENKLITLWSDIRGDYDSDEEAWQAAQNAITQAQNLYR